MAARRFDRTLVALIAAVVAVTVLLYARTARYGFINFDDYHYVVNNPHIQNGLSLSSVRWALTTGYFSYWHPMTWLGYLTLISLFGVEPGPMHVANVLIHAANAGLLLYLLWRTTGRLWPAAIAAAIFAWHPLRVESVAWISELKDVLSAFFWLLTTLVYVRYAERPTAMRYVVILVCYLLGLASKPMLVMLPATLLLLDYWPLRRTRWLGRDDGVGAVHVDATAVPRATLGRLILEKVPLFAMAMVVALYAIRVQADNYALAPDLAIWLRLQNAIVAITGYLGKLVWPTNLAAFYPHPGLVVNGGIGIGITILAAVVLLALTVAALLFARRKPYLLIGWLWLLGTLLPVSGVVRQAGLQAMADRYSYIPLIFITVAAVWLVADWLAGRPRARPLVAAVTAGVLVALLVKSTIQIGYWRDDTALFTHALKVTKNNYLAHASLGYAHYTEGRIEDAMAQYRLALKVRPNDPLSNANMGKALQYLGRLKEAEAYYRRAIRFSPPDSDLHNNVANILAGQAKFDEAIRHHELATRIGGEFAHTHYNFGVTLFQLGRLTEAQAALERALQRKPDNPDARYTYGLVMAGLGYEVAATGQLREANRLRSDWFEALRSLAWLLATSPDPTVRDGKQAVLVAERANQITGYENPIALDTLAVAYAEAGRFDSAVATATRAEQLARARGENELADRFAARLELYRAGNPFHRVAGATTQPFNP